MFDFKVKFVRQRFNTYFTKKLNELLLTNNYRTKK